ncbi:MAG: zonular occludens toxin domain-containing protein [Candidatus Woesearchaeota archaeon]
MAKKKKEKNEEETKKHSPLYKGILSIIRMFNRIVIFIIEIPYFLYKGIVRVTRYAKKKNEQVIIKKEREKMMPTYEPLLLIESYKGKLDEFEKEFFKNESTIGIIIGSRGSGKSALGMKLSENMYARKKRRVYAMGFEEKTLPSWINNTIDTSEIKNDSLILIDEGGILFSSRKSMSQANKLLSELMLIARHKGLSIIFISQNSSNLDVNILRQADYLMLRHPSLLQLEFERDTVKKLYEEYKGGFEKRKDDKGLTLVYSGQFIGFASNSLPSFWTKKMSTSFRKNNNDQSK